MKKENCLRIEEQNFEIPKYDLELSSILLKIYDSDIKIVWKWDIQSSNQNGFEMVKTREWMAKYQTNFKSVNCINSNIFNDFTKNTYSIYIYLLYLSQTHLIK